MGIDISEISTPDLRDILSRIPDELKKRDAQARAKVIAEVQTLVKSHGYSLDDLISKPNDSGGQKRVKEVVETKKVAPKYANPDDVSVTWTGRGRKPGALRALHHRS